jgi:AraC-like DNA-binding protein
MGREGVVGDEVACLAGEADRIFKVVGDPEVHQALREAQYAAWAVPAHAILMGSLHIVDTALLGLNVLESEPHRDRVIGGQVKEVTVLMGRSGLSDHGRLVEVLHVDRAHRFVEADGGQLREFASVLHEAFKPRVVLPHLLKLFERVGIVLVFVVNFGLRHRWDDVLNEALLVRAEFTQFVGVEEAGDGDVAVEAELMVESGGVLFEGCVVHHGASWRGWLINPLDFVHFFAEKIMKTIMFRFHLHAYGEFSPRHPWGRTVWPHHDLLFVHEGGLLVKPEIGAPIELEAGEGVLIFPETPFVISSGAGRKRARASVQHFEVLAGAPLVGGFSKLRDQRAGVARRSGPPDLVLSKDVARAIDMATVEPSVEGHAMREALLLLILGRFLAGATTGKAGSREFHLLLEWVRAQAVGGLTPRAVADHCEVSASTLRRRFQQELGMSPGQFLLKLRMNEAKRLLRETLRPIKEIAVHCGYGSAIAFHRAFQESFGMTPRNYRLGNQVRG